MSESTTATPVSFDGLLREALSVIPAYAPIWTNHNTADPGITLIELLAYFSEVLVYRAQRLTPDARLNLLRLLRGAEWTGWQSLIGRPVADVDGAIARQIEHLSQVQSAVTPQDFERLAVQFAAEHLQSSQPVQAKCLSSANMRDMLGASIGEIVPGDITVVLAPEFELPGNGIEELRREVRSRLQPRALLTTRVHVVAPVYVSIYIGCRIAPFLEDGCDAAFEAANAALRRRFGPSTPDDTPPTAQRLGRPVHLSDLTAIIDDTQEVDYVEAIQVLRIELTGGIAEDPGSDVGIRVGVHSTIGADTYLGGTASRRFDRFVRDSSGEVIRLDLRPWELARVELIPEAVHRIADAQGGSVP
jgi:hypothetical protein